MSTFTAPIGPPPTAEIRILPDRSGRVRDRRVTKEGTVDAGEVYRQFSRSVYGYLRGQRVEDPDDLLGEVFFQVARSLPGFTGGDAELRRWVFTIARNRVIDDRRRRARRPRVVSYEPPETAVPEPEDRSEELIELLGILTEEQREVVALRFIADLSLEDVAELTDRSVGAVKSMQHRALEQLSRAAGRREGRTDG